MQTINIRNIILERSPDFLSSFPAFVRNIVLSTIERIIHQKEINEFIVRHNNKKGIAFASEVLEYIDFSFSISGKDRLKIPSEGRLIIVSNHPLGGLDGIVLLKLISEIRHDVKIVVNDVLLNIENMSNLFLPLDLVSGKALKENLRLIGEALTNEEAVIIFPAGEVSRLGINGISDGKWNKGAVFFAEKYNAPVLPIHIKGRNSLFFYLLSAIYKKASTFLLSHELFNKKNQIISIKVGDYINPKAFSTKTFKPNVLAKQLKKHVYALAKNKEGIFQTEKNVIHPVERKILKSQLKSSVLLGTTNDGKQIFLTDSAVAPDVLTEIARLRELTFRKVGEGTGNKLDLDRFDNLYKHLVLWDDKELEIVGSYRIGIGKQLSENSKYDDLYTSTLFTYGNDIKEIIPHAIELGRSFVQSKYWKTSALDYLWQGIGAFLAFHPDVKFLFGPVSISNAYSDDAKSLIIYFYWKWFGTISETQANCRYQISPKRKIELEEIFEGPDFKADFKRLKNHLKNYGYSVPTLYKQYTDLCDDGGVKFLDFGIDKDFQDCIDGLIIVDTDKLKLSKKERYIYPHLSAPQEQHSQVTNNQL